MSTLREMAREVSKRLDGEADFFLVIRDRVPDVQTGQRTAVVSTNVSTDSAVDMAAAGTTKMMLGKLFRARARARKSHGNT